MPQFESLPRHYEDALDPPTETVRHAQSHIKHDAEKRNHGNEVVGYPKFSALFYIDKAFKEKSKRRSSENLKHETKTTAEELYKIP